MKDIYILGDSLALPRPEIDSEEAHTYRDTYIAFLTEKLLPKDQFVIHNGKRARTIKEVDNLIKEVIFSGAKTLIIQVGIVDCAPRVFSKKQYWLMNKLPKVIRNPILKLVRKYKLQILKIRPNIVYTKKTVFENHLKSISEKLLKNEIKGIFCSIVPAGEDMVARNPQINKQIDEYNDLIKKILIEEKILMIPMDKLYKGQLKQCLMADGHHLSKKGHQILGAKLLKILEV